MKLTLKTTYTEQPSSGVAIPAQFNEIDITNLNRRTITVPAKVGSVKGTATVYLPTGYFTDVNVPSSWVSYTSSDLKFLGIFLTTASRYAASTQGASSIDSLNTAVLESASTRTDELIMDAPLAIVESGAGGLLFSDFFNNEVPYKVELYNAITSPLEFEILTGLNLS